MDRQIRILLADGNEEFCGRLKQTLEEDGRFAVVGVAGDGVRACELMQSCHPDVLALDLMLPKMDGIAVLKKAQELESAPRALVMTGFMTEYVGAMAAELGVQYFMSKPCDCRAVADRIREMVSAGEKTPARRNDANIEARGDHDRCERYGRHQCDHEGALSSGRAQILDHGFPRGARHPACDRGRVGSGRSGDASAVLRIYRLEYEGKTDQF